MGCGICCYK